MAMAFNKAKIINFKESMKRGKRWKENSIGKPMANHLNMMAISIKIVFLQGMDF